MENVIKKNSGWTSHEMQMLNHVEVFIHKPGIMKKGEKLLTELGEGMMEELSRSKINFPPGTKLDKTQLARGENNNGFPFLSLDIPQMFSRTEMFTFRTLFWWGHYLGFSLILKGERLPLYANKLIQNINNPAWSDVYLATTPTPWEWIRTDQNFKRISEAEEGQLKSIIESINHIKVMRFFPIDDPSFASLDWTAKGISAWKDLSSLAGVLE
jgi:hypothetical protein